MTATNYLDYAGLQRFKTKLDAQYANLYRTETQVNSQIDAKLATYSQNYVQISSDVPTIAGGAQEGIIYLVPDGNAPQGSFKYIAYAVESVSGTPTVVKLGTGTTEIPTVDQTVIEHSTNAVAGGAVFDELAKKVDKTDDVTGSVTNGETKVVTSGGVYTELTTNWVAKNDIASAVTASDTTHVVTGDAVATYVASVVDDYVEESRVTSNAPASASTDICTSGAMFTALGLKVDTSSIVDSITDGNMNPVTSNAVYDALADIQTISDTDIDALFSSGSSGSGS